MSVIRSESGLVLASNDWWVWLMDSKKRTADDQDSQDDNDDFGVSLPPPVAGTSKKQRLLLHESLYLDNLPSADQYERSLMHRDVVNYVFVSRSTDFIITTSVDGHVKFWKKTKLGIEFAKHFRAHIAPIIAAALDNDGLLFATTSFDNAIKVFDVLNFDMINMVKINFLPKTLCWAFQPGQAQALLACSEMENSNIHFYDARDANQTPLFTASKIHSKPVTIMKYNSVCNVVVSVDSSGMFEYWHPDPEVDFATPDTSIIKWKYKSETDLFEYKKAKSVPSSLEFSLDQTKFVTTGLSDRQICIFNFFTGKLIRKYDESLQVIQEMQQAATAIVVMDPMDFGRRLAVDREIQSQEGGQSSTANAVFDESGNFVIYATLLGIKIVNIRTNKVSRIIGKNDTQRFLNLSLYQGAPRKKGIITLDMAASDNPALKEIDQGDPTIFATAYKKNRFYLYTKREPETDDTGHGRDIFNEKPSREEQMAAMQTNLKQTLGSAAIIHTTMGDIHIRLFPEYAPKAVENFTALCKKNYYDNVTFHRVIKGFMIQTGDPNGDGTGGESIWGHEFEDEFSKHLKHDRAFTVSMANAGPNTNGSQFFITTAPTEWLDNKHTIFGRATGGMDVITRIENVKTDKRERPMEKIKILTIDVR
ncbi:hypothetical protein HK098_001884 [Nowakowskiella sp. JEL0407]|nr:hypothetical protein HK098_001884 [Nowakowskiella sp. JEL0407]